MSRGAGRAQVAGLQPQALCFPPEFLGEGSTVLDFLHPNRIVIGTDEARRAQKVATLCAGVKSPMLLRDVASAELSKYASNASFATKISFISKIANVREAVGADVKVVA